MKKIKSLPKNKLKQFRNMFLEKQASLISHNEISLVDDFENGDEVDIAQGLIINEMVAKLSLREKEAVQKISEALQRIDKGIFGLCEDCEEPIAEKRLLAIPYCTTCIGCAEQQEILSKQYRR